MIEDMKALVKYLLAICVMASACTKPDEGSGKDTARILGTYSFDGKVENILRIEYSENDTEVHFIFSPVFKGRLTTYIDFSLSKALLNEECDVKELSPMEDYHFTYEDPIWYYSELRPLKDGTLLVKILDDGTADVSVDVLLNDGTPFTLSYKGVVRKDVSR